MDPDFDEWVEKLGLEPYCGEILEIYERVSNTETAEDLKLSLKDAALQLFIFTGNCRVDPGSGLPMSKQKARLVQKAKDLDKAADAIKDLLAIELAPGALKPISGAGLTTIGVLFPGTLPDDPLESTIKTLEQFSRASVALTMETEEGRDGAPKKDNLHTLIIALCKLVKEGTPDIETEGMTEAVRDIMSVEIREEYMPTKKTIGNIWLRHLARAARHY